MRKLVTRLRISGAVTSILQYALMACTGVTLLYLFYWFIESLKNCIFEYISVIILAKCY